MRASPPRCRRFRPHPWRKGICIDCFTKEANHTVAAPAAANAAQGQTNCSPPRLSETAEDRKEPVRRNQSQTLPRNSSKFGLLRPSSTAGDLHDDRPMSCPLDCSPMLSNSVATFQSSSSSPSTFPWTSKEADSQNSGSMGIDWADSEARGAHSVPSQVGLPTESDVSLPRNSTAVSGSTTSSMLGDGTVDADNLSVMESPVFESTGDASSASQSAGSLSGASHELASESDCGSETVTPYLSLSPAELASPATDDAGIADFVQNAFSSEGRSSSPAALPVFLGVSRPLDQHRMSTPHISLEDQERIRLNAAAVPFRRTLSETDLDIGGSGDILGDRPSGKRKLKNMIKKVISRGKEFSPMGKSPNRMKDGEFLHASPIMERSDSDTSSNSRSGMDPTSTQSSVTSVALEKTEGLASSNSVTSDLGTMSTLRLHYARASDSWDQACVRPEVLAACPWDNDVPPVHQACVFPYRQRHTRETLSTISIDLLSPRSEEHDSSVNLGSCTCNSIVADMDSAGISWSEYFENVDVNPTVDEELTSIQSGLRALWDKSLELCAKFLPSDITTAATNWEKIQLIGHDTGQYPSTIYAHLEYDEQGSMKSFSMEIEMGVPKKKKNTMCPLSRDCLIRSSIAPHFNILQPRGKISQRLPIEIECKMDMAISDLIARNCFVTDFLGNYVSGYTFVSLCLMGKKLREYEERVILLVLQLLLALEHAHNHGVVHRCVELDKILIGTVEGLGGDRLILNGFEYALSAGSDKRIKLEACDHPPPEWFVYDVNDLMYLGCNIGHLPPEIIGLCDSSPQLDFNSVDAYAVGVFISELLEVFDDNHHTVLRYISKAMMAPAPSIRLTLTRARRILECWLWGPRSWLKKGKGAADVPLSRTSVRQWLCQRQTALLSTVALRGMLDQLTVGDLLHSRFLSSSRAAHIVYAGQWLQQLVAAGKI